MTRNPSHDSFGFTIAASDNNEIYVSRVDRHAPAFTSGLRVGDHVVCVNGCDVTAASLLDVASLVRCVTMTTTAATLRYLRSVKINLQRHAAWWCLIHAARVSKPVICVITHHNVAVWPRPLTLHIKIIRTPVCLKVVVYIKFISSLLTLAPDLFHL